MKKISNPTPSIKEKLINFFFTTFGMLNILGIFLALFLAKANTAIFLITISFTFIGYLILYANIFQLLLEHHYFKKLILQLILANLAFEITIFATMLMHANPNKFGWLGVGIVLVLSIITNFLLVKEQAKEYTLKKAVVGEKLYETLIVIAITIFIVSFFYQIYVLWKSWYIWAPIVTGSVMLATINKKGITSSENCYGNNLYRTIPYIFTVGLLSAILQFKSVMIMNTVKLGELALICSVLSLVVFALYKLSKITNEEKDIIDKEAKKTLPGIMYEYEEYVD
ncbi:MAG: hypothetical protein KGI58_01720 [Patescibacteria group bacterium]|nr:hypothetical protein [Patescibacteria group bacterium]